MNVTLEKMVSDIVTEYPGTIPVFEQFGIDYCCGGKQPLGQACEKKRLDVSEVVAAIDAESQETTELSGQRGSLAEMCQHITERHHEHERQEFLLMRGLLEKVQRKHGASHPEVFFIAESVASLEKDLLQHFRDEEDVLFPYIASLESESTTIVPTAHNLSQPIQRMLSDHEHAGEQLSLLRETTNNYQPPADACTTFRALWRTLEDFEKDLHLHVHLENNILFPRALALMKEKV
jgi:regulator of cell morphogenesis and NO signaling